ncbi:MAG: glycoside hydrolase family 13 protein [Eubacterium sp.]|nr:glycoside hydrolase family 13 protein [Eubacterium sp.]
MKHFKIIADNKSFGQKSGTVKKGEAFVTQILIPRTEAALEVRLNIRNDAEEDFLSIKMNRKTMKEGYDVYEANVDTSKVGLYFFSISVEKHHWTDYTHRRGPFVYLSGDEHDIGYFQLMVYERKYKAPEFLYGGLFYHIFVDRFYRGSKNEDLSYTYSQIKGDKVKSKYDVKNFGEDFDNREKRTIIIRDKWGAQPIWQADMHREILNNDFFGGTLLGIREKLGYLKELGVSCLYLSPVFEAYSSHKYDTGDYNKIDAMFGDEEEFKLLCKEAKEAGINIMLDGVFNHTGSDSIYFNAYNTYDEVGAYQSKESRYIDWFYFDNWPKSYKSWWGIGTLPTVNKECASHSDYLFGKNGIIRKYIRLGASGWRLDVVDEIPDRLVKELTKAAKTEREDAVVLGEVWEDASNKIAYSDRREYFWGRELDSVMNYPWKDGIIGFIRNKDAFFLGSRVDEIISNYPPEVIDCLMNPLGTHDSMRILTALAAENLGLATREDKAFQQLTFEEKKRGVCLLKLASLLQMTLPGVPCIYYADEAQMEGFEDPFNRRCYPWGDENEDLLMWYKQLGNLRKDKRGAFYKTSFKLLFADEGVFGFERENDDYKLICIVNRSDKAVDYKTDIKTEAIHFDQSLNKTYYYALGALSDFDEAGLYHIPEEYGYLLLINEKR